MIPKLKFSIIVPVYRGEQTIKTLFKKIQDVLAIYSFEVIFVYDNGIDNSWSIIKHLSESYPKIVKGEKLSRNYGQHNALLAGISKARGEYIITMDEDLQHDPKYVIDLFNKQQETDCDVVYGKYSERNHSFFRNTTSFFAQKLLMYSIPDLHQDYSAFRLIKREIAFAILQMKNSYTFLDGYLSWVTTNIDSIKIEHHKSLAGKSSYTVKKLVEHSINIFVTFSNLPIRLVTFSSFIFFFLSSFYSIYILYKKIVYDNLIPGFSTLVISIGFGMGFILLALGILGEYIYRINLKTTQKPNYNISKST